MRPRLFVRGYRWASFAATVAFSAFAHAQGAATPAPPAPTASTVPPGPSASPPAPSAGAAAAPSTEPPEPANPAPEPSAQAAPPPPIPPVMPASPGPPQPPPGSVAAQPPVAVSTATAFPPADAASAQSEPAPAMMLGLELAMGMTAGGRFPSNEAARSVEEAVDATYGLALWLGSRTLQIGLGAERVGLGKDHYATNANGETKEASYGADVLSLLGRFYLSERRPAMYLGLSLGPALPTVRATGTVAPEGVFVTPGTSYACSDTGKVGFAGSLSAGVEFEVAKGFSLLADARATGFAMSRAANGFGGCAPGSGPAVVGALRLGAAYRFGL